MCEPGHLKSHHPEIEPWKREHLVHMVIKLNTSSGCFKLLLGELCMVFALRDQGKRKQKKKNCTTSREQGRGIRGHCKEPDTLLRPLLRQFHLLFLPLPTAAIHMMTVLLTLASAWPLVAGAWQSCQSWAFCWQLIGRPEKGELLQLSERLASWARLRWKWQSGGLRKDRQAALEQAYVNQPDRAVP